MTSYLAKVSPRKRKAIIVAKIGEVLPRNATFESEISLTAALKMKNVIVPDTDRTMTSFHWCSVRSIRFA